MPGPFVLRIVAGRDDSPAYGPTGPALDSGIVPPSGYRSWSIVVPPLPPGTPVVFQPISFRATGLIVLGTPTVVVFG